MFELMFTFLEYISLSMTMPVQHFEVTIKQHRSNFLSEDVQLTVKNKTMKEETKALKQFALHAFN